MVKKLRDFRDYLIIKGVKCTIYSKHDLEQLEEDNKQIPNKNIVFVKNELVKIFYDIETSRMEIETSENKIKINKDILSELMDLTTIVNNFNINI